MVYINNHLAHRQSCQKDFGMVIAAAIGLNMVKQYTDAQIEDVLSQSKA